jgi:hypothetical protein
MPPKPRLQIRPDWTADRWCFICGNPTLQPVHVENLPDYVVCKKCQSAFVLEDGGERILYGKIGEGYPETSGFALRQWHSPEEVESYALRERPASERPAAPPAPPEVEELEPPEEEAIPSAAVPIPTEPEPEVPVERPVLLRTKTPPGIRPTAISDLEQERPTEEDTPILTPSMESIPEQQVEVEPPEEGREGLEEESFTPLETDPPPGQRFRVVVKGTRIQFPATHCAHCMRQPVRGRLAVLGTLPRGQEIGQRQPATFNLPLCTECHRRASRRSQEEKSARLQAYLLSTLAALVVLVAVLAWGVIDIAEQGLTGAFMLMILAVLGFSAPAWFLLNRLQDFPPPLDAAYVRSTLLVPREPQGLETVFEWRNEAYAELFWEANEPIAISKVTRVKDRSRTYPS